MSAQSNKVVVRVEVGVFDHYPGETLVRFDAPGLCAYYVKPWEVIKRGPMAAAEPLVGDIGPSLIVFKLAADLPPEVRAVFEGAPQARGWSEITEGCWMADFGTIGLVANAPRLDCGWAVSDYLGGLDDSDDADTLTEAMDAAERAAGVPHGVLERPAEVEPCDDDDEPHIEIYRDAERMMWAYTMGSHQLNVTESVIARARSKGRGEAQARWEEHHRDLDGSTESETRVCGCGQGVYIHPMESGCPDCAEAEPASIVVIDESQPWTESDVERVRAMSAERSKGAELKAVQKWKWDSAHQGDERRAEATWGDVRLFIYGVVSLRRWGWIVETGEGGGVDGGLATSHGEAARTAERAAGVPPGVLERPAEAEGSTFGQHRDAVQLVVDTVCEAAPKPVKPFGFDHERNCHYWALGAVWLRLDAHEDPMAHAVQEALRRWLGFGGTDSMRDTWLQVCGCGGVRLYPQETADVCPTCEAEYERRQAERAAIRQAAQQTREERRRALWSPLKVTKVPIKQPQTLNLTEGQWRDAVARLHRAGVERGLTPEQAKAIAPIAQRAAQALDRSTDDAVNDLAAGMGVMVRELQADAEDYATVWDHPVMVALREQRAATFTECTAEGCTSAASPVAGAMGLCADCASERDRVEGRQAEPTPREREVWLLSGADARTTPPVWSGGVRGGGS